MGWFELKRLLAKGGNELAKSWEAGITLSGKFQGLFLVAKSFLSGGIHNEAARRQ
jgi:hypothetical protein